MKGEEGGGRCKIFCFFYYLSRPQCCFYIMLGLINLLVICKSLPVVWATIDLLRSLEILCYLETHILCVGNRESHLLGLLFQTIYSYKRGQFLKGSDNIFSPLEIFCGFRAHLICIINGEGLHQSMFVKNEKIFIYTGVCLIYFQAQAYLGH